MKNDIILIGAIAIGAYFIWKQLGGSTADLTGGGGGGTGGTIAPTQEPIPTITPPVQQQVIQLPTGTSTATGNATPYGSSRSLSKLAGVKYNTTKYGGTGKAEKYGQLKVISLLHPTFARVIISGINKRNALIARKRLGGR